MSIDAMKQKAEPVAWCVAYDDPRMGRIHSNPSMCEPEVDAHVAKCDGRIVKVPLYTTPQQPAIPDELVLVPVEPTEEMMKAMQQANIYPPRNTDGTVSVRTQNLHIYKAMLAVAPKVPK